jgi:hypothetical protein
MDCAKEALVSGSVEFESAKKLLEQKYQLFLSYIDNLDTVSFALSYASGNFFDMLLRILKIFSGHYDSNYCIYENPYGLLFDASSNSIAKAM